jgi:hypothetical protein
MEAISAMTAADVIARFINITLICKEKMSVHLYYEPRQPMGALETCDTLQYNSIGTDAVRYRTDHFRSPA